jgi:hypothetical protein
MAAAEIKTPLIAVLDKKEKKPPSSCVTLWNDTSLVG